MQCLNYNTGKVTKVFFERSFRMRTTSLSISKRELKNRRLARKIAAEGMVLLKNDGVLPLSKSAPIAVYGFGARYTVKGGTGSGAVNNRVDVSVYEGLKNKEFIITNEDWLNDYDKRYILEREKWEQEILRRTGTPIEYRKLYHEHASNPLNPPKGRDISAEDIQDNDVAIYVISRVSGEFADRKARKGDYYFSDAELDDLQSIIKYYKKTILVLNTGGIIDLSVLDSIDISAVILMSQAGMEGGNALADILDGTVTPSGHLTDTWAYKYEDYPNSETYSHNNGNTFEEYYTEGIYVGYRYFDTFDIPVRYPFGFGMSYTTFDIKVEKIAKGKDLYDGKYGTGMIESVVSVTNTGNTAGKQVVQLYVSCPQAIQEKEKRRLVGWGKTKLLQPGETETKTIGFPVEMLKSYNTGKGVYYMEQGDYYIFAGSDIQNLELCGSLRLSETRQIRKVRNICPLNDSLKLLSQKENALSGFLEKCKKEAQEKVCINIDDLVHIQDEPDYNADSMIEKYDDEEINGIISQMSLVEKASLVCGQLRKGGGDIVGSASATVAGAAGETIGSLKEKYGIGKIIMADGPAGLRLTQKYQVDDEGKPIALDQIQKLMNRCFGKEYLTEGRPVYYQFCTALPIGTLLAQSYDREVWRIVGDIVAEEMDEFNINLWLAPGMNIHRNPLCGRNYEYYSEDPMLSGEIAACITNAVQRDKSKGTTIKHFACNNQEENRMHSSSIVSERALREIYLSGFEYAVERSKPVAIMSSYNKINGIHAANNYDLCTNVARMEWGFEGFIMTDWTTTNGNGSSAAKCIWSGNDLVMPGTIGDITEIMDAVESKNDQTLDIKYMDASVYRIIKSIKYDLECPDVDASPQTR